MHEHIPKLIDNLPKYIMALCALIGVLISWKSYQLKKEKNKSNNDSNKKTIQIIKILISLVFFLSILSTSFILFTEIKLIGKILIFYLSTSISFAVGSFVMYFIVLIAEVLDLISFNIKK